MRKSFLRFLGVPGWGTSVKSLGVAPLFGPTWRDTAIESSKADAVGSLVLQNRLHDVWSERVETKHSTHVAHVNLIGGSQFHNLHLLRSEQCQQLDD